MFQVLIGKDMGPGTPAQLLAYYDEDDVGTSFVLQNNGTFIVRPVAVGDTGSGVWIGI